MTSALTVLLAVSGVASPPPFPAPPPFPPVSAVAKAPPDCGCKDECKCNPCRCAGPKATPVETKAATVLVTQDLGNNLVGYGTGVVVGKEKNGDALVLTNLHLVAGSGAVTVYAAGTPFKAEVVRKSEDRKVADLALLRCKAAHMDPVRLAKAEPAAGSAVYLWGYAGRTFGPNGAAPEPARKDGVTTPDRPVNDAASTSIPAAVGDSGAGVFDADGRMVGLTYGGIPQIRIPHVMVPLAAVKEFLAGKKAAAAADVVHWRKDFKAAQAEAKRDGKPFVVLVTNLKTCVPCKALEAGPLTDPGVVAALNRCVPVRVDTSVAGNAAWAEKCGYDRTPTLVVVDKYGVSQGYTGDVTADKIHVLVTAAADRTVTPPPPAAPAVLPQPAAAPVYYYYPAARASCGGGG